MKRRLQETPIFHGKKAEFPDNLPANQTHELDKHVPDIPYVALLQDLSHSISKFEEGSAKLIAKDGRGQWV